MQLSDIVKLKNLDIEVLKKLGIKALIEMKFRFWLESWQYDIWFSGSFKKRTDVYASLKQFKYFFKHLNKPNNTYYKDRIVCWVFVEKKPCQDRVHLHALIQGIDSTRAKDIEDEWIRLLGEAKVKPYDPTFPATQYLAKKYANKNGQGWLKTFDFFKINSKWRTHKKVDFNRLCESPNKVAFW